MATAKEIDELLDVIENLVYQHCPGGFGDHLYGLDSRAISSDARAIRKLAEYGRVKISYDKGQRVIAEPLEVQCPQSHTETDG